MKLDNNRVAGWLDGIHRNMVKQTDGELDGPIDFISYYQGAMDLLEVMGVSVNKIPCAGGVIHLLNHKGETLWE